MNIFINKDEQRLRAGWRLLIQFILLFLITGLAYTAIHFFWGSSLALANALASFVGFVASIWLAARLLDKRSFFDFGLNFDQTWSNDFLVGILIGTLAMGTIFLVEWYFGWVSIIGYGWQTATYHSFGWTLSISLAAMLLVGFHEELFSRGYQVLNLSEGLNYPQLGKRGTVIIAVSTSSVLFGSLHLLNPNASAISTINIIIAGIVLAIPFVLTGSLGLSVGLHFSWNFVQAGVCGFPVSGMNFQTSVFRIQQAGSDLWTGGAFGPEAGLLGLLGLATILLLSCVYIKVTRNKLGIAKRFCKDFQPSLKSDEHKP